MDSGNGRVEALARHIKTYLAGNPRARDTADGIRLWWLGDWASATLAEVEQALDDLVRQGILSRVTLIDGRTIYGVAAARAGNGHGSVGN